MTTCETGGEGQTFALPSADRRMLAVYMILASVFFVLAVAGLIRPPMLGATPFFHALAVAGCGVLALGSLTAFVVLLSPYTWRVTLCPDRLQSRGFRNKRTVSYGNIQSVSADWLGLKMRTQHEDTLRIFLFSLHHTSLGLAPLVTALMRRCPAVEQCLRPSPPWESPIGKNALYPLGWLALLTGIAATLFVPSLVDLAAPHVSGLIDLEIDNRLLTGVLAWILIPPPIVLLFLSRHRVTVRKNEISIHGFQHNTTHKLDEVTGMKLEGRQNNMRAVLETETGGVAEVPINPAGIGLPPIYIVGVLAHIYLDKPLEEIPGYPFASG